MRSKLNLPGAKTLISQLKTQSDNAKRTGEECSSPAAWARPLILILVIGGTVLILWMGGRIQQLGRYGYPGIFLLNLLANATVILPLPGVVVTSAFGAVLNPFWVSIAAGTERHSASSRVFCRVQRRAGNAGTRRQTCAVRSVVCPLWGWGHPCAGFSSESCV